MREREIKDTYLTYLRGDVRYLPQLPGKICDILTFLRETSYYSFMTLGDIRSSNGEKTSSTEYDAKGSEL